MATTKAREAHEQAQVEMEQSPEEQLAYLQAEAKRIAEQMKAVKAALPTVTPLEKEMRRQAQAVDAYVVRWIVKRIQARVRLGQERTDALNEVMRVLLTYVIQAVDAEEQAAAQAAEGGEPETQETQA